MLKATIERLRVLKAKRARLQTEVDEVERRGGVHPSGEGVPRQDEISQQVSNIQKAEISELTRKIENIETETMADQRDGAG